MIKVVASEATTAPLLIKPNIAQILLEKPNKKIMIQCSLAKKWGFIQRWVNFGRTFCVFEHIFAGIVKYSKQRFYKNFQFLWRTRIDETLKPQHSTIDVLQLKLKLAGWSLQCWAFKEPRSRFQGIDTTILCSPAGRQVTTQFDVPARQAT